MMGRTSRTRQFGASTALLLAHLSVLPGSGGDPCPAPHQPGGSANKLVLTGSPFDGFEVTASHLRTASDDAPLVVYEGDLAVDGTTDLFTQRPLDGLELTSLGAAAAAGAGGFTIQGIYDSRALFFDTDPTLPLHGVDFESGSPPNRVDPQPVGYTPSPGGTRILFDWGSATFPCTGITFPAFATIDTVTGAGVCYGTDLADQDVDFGEFTTDGSWFTYIEWNFNPTNQSVRAEHFDTGNNDTLWSDFDSIPLPDLAVRNDGLAIYYSILEIDFTCSTYGNLVGSGKKTLAVGNDACGLVTYGKGDGDAVAIVERNWDGQATTGNLYIAYLDTPDSPQLILGDWGIGLGMASFTPDRSYFAITRGAELWVSPTTAANQMTQVPTTGVVVDLGHSPDGATLLIAQERVGDLAVELWSVPTVGGAPVLIGPAVTAGAVGVTEWTFADGRVIVFGGFDGTTLQLYSMETDGTDIQQIALPGPTDSVTDFWVFDGGVVLKLDGSSQLRLAPSTGGAAAPLTVPGTEDAVSDPQVAEDGAFLIYDAVIEGADRETVIYFADSDFDADGVPNATDNCFATPNADQADVDGDCLGDACDDCTGHDLDSDLVCAFDDNCPFVANPEQFDTDADSVGDLCDACTDLDGDGFGDPGFPANSCAEDVCPALPNPSQDDPDLDGVGSACDNCPPLANPNQQIGPSTVLSAPLQPDGDVTEFVLSSDGSFALYLADQEIEGAFELYSVPTAGGTPVKLSEPAVSSADDVLTFAVSPLGDRVAYVWDSTSDGRDLYTVAIAGGPSTKLTPTEADFVYDYAFTPDGGRILYIGDHVAGDVDKELYSTPATGGGVSKLSQAGDRVHDFTISPDGQRVVYRADDGSPPFEQEIWSLKVSFPFGIAVKLNGSLTDSGDVIDYLVSPSSSRVVYRADQDTNNVSELYGVDIVGGTATKLNAPLGVSEDVTSSFRISPDSARVIYLASLDITNELFSVPIAGGAAVKLNDTIAPGGAVSSEFDISPDSSDVIYMAALVPNPLRELHRVPILGGSSVTLNPPFVVDTRVQGFELSGDGSLVAYFAQIIAQNLFKTDLFAVPFAGGPSTRLNDDLDEGGSVFTSFSSGNVLSSDNQFVVYRARPETGAPAELYAARTSGVGLAQKLNGTSISGAGALSDFLLTAGSDALLYRRDETTAGVIELYRATLEPDGDGDGIVDSCDCASGDASAFNTPSEVANLHVEQDGVTFAWASGVGDSGTGLTYELVRGDVAEFPVGTGVAETCVDTGINGTTYVDTFEPLPGDAAFYLLRGVNACGTGSYGFESPSGSERTTGACPG